MTSRSAISMTKGRLETMDTPSHYVSLPCSCSKHTLIQTFCTPQLWFCSFSTPAHNDWSFIIYYNTFDIFYKLEPTEVFRVSVASVKLCSCQGSWSRCSPPGRRCRPSPATSRSRSTNHGVTETWIRDREARRDSFVECDRDQKKYLEEKNICK